MNFLPLIRLVTNRFSAIAALAIVFLVSIAAAITYCDPEFFSRAGAVMVLAGILLTTRSLLFHGFDKSFGSLPSLPDKDESDEDKEKLKQEERDTKETVNAERYGFFFLCVGTLIWAYGDILFKFLMGW